MTPIPALTLRHNTPHNNQNCGVRMASFTCTCADVTSGFCVIAGPDGGCHPGGGSRYPNAPSIIATK
jgi:hypothetical protein